MEIMELPTARLRRRLDCRALNEGNVKNLMECMRREGFWKSSPLRVRPIKIREATNGNIDGWEITSGRHRFEAAWRLNFETAPCVIETEDDLHAELSMIDENLVRSDLGPVDLAKQTARRKIIHEQLYPETKHHVSGGLARHNSATTNLVDAEDGFVSNTSAKTGRSKTTVRRDARRGANISDGAADKLRGTHLDKGEFLDELEKIAMADQVQFVEQKLSEKKMPSKRGRPRNKDDSPTTKGEAAAVWIFANIVTSKIPAFIRILEGTRPKYIIATLRRKLAE